MCVATAALLALTLQAAPTSVSVDLAELDEPSQKQVRAVELERYLVLRLVQEGFAVVPPSASPRVKVKVTVASGQLTLEARSEDREAHRTVTLSGIPVSELHLELAQRMTELVRRVDVERPAPPVVTQPTQPPPAEEPRLRHELALSVAALWRGSPDAQVALHFESELVPHLELTIAASFSPSRGTGLNVYEEQLRVGGAFVFARGDQFDLQLGIELGVLVHAFVLDDPTATTPSGVRFTPTAAVPLVFDWRFSGRWRAGAFVAGSAAVFTRDHQLAGQSMWARSAFGVQAGLRLGVGF